MTRRSLVFVLIMLISGCASPAFNMTDQQIHTLSDDQLCSFKNGYRAEARTEAEVARRGLNCNRYHRECLRRGNRPGTQAMDFCMDLLRENERLRYDDDFDVFGYGGRHHHRHGGIGVGMGF
jgi:hypothetical protein